MNIKITKNVRGVKHYPDKKYEILELMERSIFGKITSYFQDFENEELDKEVNKPLNL